jgi:hypothetical protein
MISSFLKFVGVELKDLDITSISCKFTVAHHRKYKTNIRYFNSAYSDRLLLHLVSVRIAYSKVRQQVELGVELINLCI